MKNYKMNIMAILILMFLCFQTNAQDAYLSGGGEASGTGGSSSYSIGQVIYTTNSGATGSVAQGVQQAYEVSIVSQSELVLNMEVSVFPNPSSDLLNLELTSGLDKEVTYFLYDNTGKLLARSAVYNEITKIDLKPFPNAIYHLNVMQGPNQVKLFKIIKI